MAGNSENSSIARGRRQLVWPCDLRLGASPCTAMAGFVRIARPGVASAPARVANTHGREAFRVAAEFIVGPLAQLVEHRTFNPRVAGSIPARPTI